MNRNITFPQKLFLIVLLLFLCSSTNAQSKFGVGAFLGGGVLSGNSPNVGSFSSSVFVDIKTPLSDNIIPRFSFIYMRDINYILPGTRFGNYPYIQGYSLKLITSQGLSHNFFFEEGAGILALNDKTFNYTANWDYGALFSVVSGFDFRNSNMPGIKLGAGIEYGITFNNTLAKYFSLHVQAEYLF